MTWTKAQKYCREKYTDLATVNNMNDIFQLMKSVDNSKISFVWIGLKRSDVYKWKWSLGDPVKYTNWSNGDSNGPDDCVYMRDGSWHHQHCNMNKRFICYNESSKGFIIDGSSVSWRDAQIFCRQHHTDLTSVRNQTENQQIQKIMKDTNISEVWIGLFSDSWEWSDESESGFRNWWLFQPNNLGGSQYCTEVIVTAQAQWTDVSCSYTLTFVCHEDLKTLVTCEHYTALLSCDEGNIKVISANYGRTDNTTCSNGITAELSNVHCSLNSTLSVLTNQCDGKLNCSIDVGKPVFIVDPCGGTYKYLNVSYKCIIPPSSSSSSPSSSPPPSSPSLPSSSSPPSSSPSLSSSPNNLKLMQMNLSWSEALKYCRENHVDLVSVDSEKIQFMVTKVIHQSSTDAVWMGLRHSCAVGLWFWVNGEMVCNQNWAPGNGTSDANCDTVKSGAVQSGGDHLWISLPESQRLNFICIRK
ncbi:uncharacterized protein [Paramisgurnus dabryanus]|uniref:uncharacterized protein n=1 Tax=Paramisgurnus dabryanus TaxID=90735 RepID=UPI003CCF1804